MGILRVHLFTAIQIGVFVIMWVIKEITITSLFFPVLVRCACLSRCNLTAPLLTILYNVLVLAHSHAQLVVLVVVRKHMEFLFTEDELKHLDDIIPEETKRKREDHKQRHDDEDAHAGSSAAAGQLPPPPGAHVHFQARSTRSAQVRLSLPLFSERPNHIHILTGTSFIASFVE